MRTPSRRQLQRRSVRDVRFVLIGVFALTALVLMPLAVLKKRSEIAVSLKVSQLSFTLGAPSPDSLLTALPTRSLTLHNVPQVELGPGRLEVSTAVEAHTQEPDAWRTVRASASTVLTLPDDFASLTLEDVRLEQLRSPPGARLTFTWLAQEPNSLKLRIEGAEVSGSLTVGKTLRLSCSACQVEGAAVDEQIAARQWRFTSAREHVITFRSRDKAPVVAFEFAAGATLAERQIPLVGGIDFTQMEGKSRTSTILGDDGTITLVELPKEIKVGVGDFVVLDQVAQGFIKTLQIDNGIKLTLHARVGKLALGPAAFLKDRLPSWLEWLYARQTWVLSLQALVLVSTTVWAILKRLRIVQEE